VVEEGEEELNMTDIKGTPEEIGRKHIFKIKIVERGQKEARRQ